MSASDITLLALAVVVGAVILGLGINIAATTLAEPLHRIADAITPQEDED